MSTNPEQLHSQFEEAFNAGDLDGLLALYEPDAALIPQPGVLVRGLDEIGAALQGFLDLGGTMKLDTKQSVVVGDIAYLINRWALTGIEAEGNPAEMGSLTAEIARQQEDGSWRFVIDNAWGDLAAGE